MPIRLLAIAALSTALLPRAAAPQERPGRIDVVVRDDAHGTALHHVTVKAIGPQEVTTLTGADGEAHLVDLTPGDYIVVATLSGYNEYHSINVTVATGTVVPLHIWMSVQGRARQVDTRIDAPVVDTRARTASTAVSVDELRRVAWTRDPWTVLQTVPTVVVDRVNVGGAESGQQLSFEAKGAAPGDNTWSLDGIPITAMSAPGSSVTYFDFGMLHELRVTTGGASPQIATPGVQVNVILESGGNEWRGSGRAYFGHHRMQAKNVSKSMRPQLNSYQRAGDYKDFGAEGGGPIGRVFAWGGVGRTQPERRIFASGPFESDDVEIARDRTTLQSSAAKLTAAIDRNTRATFTYFRNHKEENAYGAGATRPQDTVFDEDATASFYKASIDRRAGHDVFLSARFAHVPSGFSLTPRAGGAVFSTDRPQDHAALDAYVFRRSHQFTFGLGWRTARDRSSFLPISDGEYWTAYAGDTIVKRRLTMTLAARWDRARSSAGSDEIVWNSVTPRLGVTYVVDRDRTTLVRGSYSVFPSQLAVTAVTALQAPVGNYATPLTHEVVFGGDHYLSSGITTTALFTWRRTSRMNWVHYRGVTSSDYAQIGRITGNVPTIGAFDIPLYRVRPGSIPPGLERVYETRDGYHQRYWGLEVAASKRFSNNWALRLGLSTNDHREYFDGPDAIADPTPTLESPNRNGAMVVRRVDAPGATGIFMAAPRYQLAGTASYMFRGLDVSLAYALRQGYVTPFYASDLPAALDPLSGTHRNVLLVADPGRSRLSVAHTLDGRLSKAFTTSGVRVYALHLDLDVFNVFNRSIVLARGYDVSRSDFNRILGITSPRTVRVGVRVSF